MLKRWLHIKKFKTLVFYLLAKTTIRHDTRRYPRFFFNLHGASKKKNRPKNKQTNKTKTKTSTVFYGDGSTYTKPLTAKETYLSTIIMYIAVVLTKIALVIQKFGCYPQNHQIVLCRSLHSERI